MSFKHYGLALDVPISYVDVGDSKNHVPWIKPTDFFQHLADLGKLNLLYAEQDTSVLTQLPRPGSFLLGLLYRALEFFVFSGS